MWRFLSALWDTGFRLRCPVCEQGALFATHFRMNKTCPHCSVRFERFQGEEIGGMTVAIVVTTAIFLAGYVFTEILTNWHVGVHLTIWLLFAVLFPPFFYRYSRALWVVFLYLSDAIYWDTEPYQDTNLTIVDAFYNREHPEDGTDRQDTYDDENEVDNSTQ